MPNVKRKLLQDTQDRIGFSLKKINCQSSIREGETARQNCVWRELSDTGS